MVEEAKGKEWFKQFLMNITIHQNTFYLAGTLKCRRLSQDVS